MSRYDTINVFQFLGEVEPCVMLMMDGSLHDYVAEVEQRAVNTATAFGISILKQYPNAPPMGDVEFALLPFWVWWSSHRQDA